jgi:hypothetical protein
MSFAEYYDQIFTIFRTLVYATIGFTRDYATRNVHFYIASNDSITESKSALFFENFDFKLHNNI